MWEIRRSPLRNNPGNRPRIYVGYNIDPLEELSVIFFAQLIHSDAIPASPPRLIRRRLKPLIYQALID